MSKQDCSPHSCAGNRIAPVHYEQLGLGTVLPQAQACDGVGPAVELPGLVLATHTAGVSVDGYTLTLAANAWNIVRAQLWQR